MTVVLGGGLLALAVLLAYWAQAQRDGAVWAAMLVSAGLAAANGGAVLLWGWP